VNSAQRDALKTVTVCFLIEAIVVYLMVSNYIILGFRSGLRIRKPVSPAIFLELHLWIQLEVGANRPSGNASVMPAPYAQGQGA
jgi:hypothetical protein